MFITFTYYNLLDDICSSKRDATNFFHLGTVFNLRVKSFRHLLNGDFQPSQQSPVGKQKKGGNMSRSRGLFVHKADPNTALVKFSTKKDAHVVIGGRMLAIPFIQRVDRISLSRRRIKVRTTKVLSKDKVSVDVDSICDVKVQGWQLKDSEMSTPGQKGVSVGMRLNYTAVCRAAQHFLGMTEEQIDEAIWKSLSKSQRAAIETFTVEEIYHQRKELCDRILEAIEKDMGELGLSVVHFEVISIKDGPGYLDTLGIIQAGKVRREQEEFYVVNEGEIKICKEQQNALVQVETNKLKVKTIESDKIRHLFQIRADQDITHQMRIEPGSARAIADRNDRDAVLGYDEIIQEASQQDGPLRQDDVTQQDISQDEIFDAEYVQ